MKRIRQLISILLTAALLSGVLCFSGANAANTAEITADYKNLNSKNWMSAIADSRYLCEINLPGSHDSATAYCKNTTNNHAEFFGFPVLNTGKYAKTQSLTLAKQLEAGVRYLDLRFSPAQGKLLLCHGNRQKAAYGLYAAGVLSVLHPVFLLAVYFISHLDIEFYAYEDEACTVPLTSESVLEQVKDFLKENPSECVIITAKKENGDKETFIKLFREQIQQLKTQKNPATNEAYLYTQNGAGVYTKMPSLSEVRGKIVLMTPAYETLGAGDMLDAGNGAGQTAFMGMPFYYENHWNVTAKKKIKYINDFVQTHCADMQKNPTKHLPYANVLKTNSNTAMRQSPYEIATQVNQSLYAPGHLVKGRYYGWIMGDFMDEETCSAIWQTNYFVFE